MTTSIAQTGSRPSRRRRVFALLAALLIAAVALLTMLPASDKRLLHTRGRFHAEGHFVIFALLAYLAVRSTRTLPKRLLLLAGVLIFGFGTEFAEHVAFGGPVEWSDVAIDAAGVMAGGILSLLTLARRASRAVTR